VETLESRFSGAAGVTIHRRSWLPDGPPRGVVVLVHGMGEHSGRYDHVGRHLASRGLAVLSYDHRGHGLSGGETGTVERFDLFLDDLSTMMDLARAEHSGVPLFALGHSMGGLILASWLLDRGPSPDLVVLSGPAIVPLLHPGDRTIDPTRLSADPAAQRAYLEDPLVLRERVQPGLFVALAEGLGTLVGRGGELDVPILLIHGDADRLCSAEGAAAWVGEGRSADKTIRLYPGGRHEMLNEVNRDEVLADLTAWIEARLPS
jgi:alpha-beta hydrolase superfamily lysophospholipase